MHFVTVVYFCVLYSHTFAQDDDNDDNWPNGRLDHGNDQVDLKRYHAELAAGDNSEFMGSNAHHNDPRYFKDFGRRFVPVYPYKYKSRVKPETIAPEEIFQYIQSPKKAKYVEDGEIIPIRAPPELVLAVMKKAKKMDTAKPSDPTEEVIREYMLRSGVLQKQCDWVGDCLYWQDDYWNDVVKEEVNPDFILRTSKHHKQTSSDDTDEGLFQDSKPISAKLLPGTKLYSLIAEIVKKSPRLVYIINDK